MNPVSMSFDLVVANASSIQPTTPGNHRSNQRGTDLGPPGNGNRQASKAAENLLALDSSVDQMIWHRVVATPTAKNGAKNNGLRGDVGGRPTPVTRTEPHLNLTQVVVHAGNATDLFPKGLHTLNCCRSFDHGSAIIHIQKVLSIRKTSHKLTEQSTQEGRQSQWRESIPLGQASDAAKRNRVNRPSEIGAD